MAVLTIQLRHIDQRERVAPDVEKTLHQLENALTAERVNARSIANGDALEKGRSTGSCLDAKSCSWISSASPPTDSICDGVLFACE